MGKSYMAKPTEVVRKWHVIDATDLVVGRLAVAISRLLMGKNKPTFTPHVDTGDFVIVVNAGKVRFTGKKWRDKQYTRYTGYPGGLKRELAEHLHARHPERVLKLAVRRMLPKNALGYHQITKLKIYAGPDHPHQAQCPQPLTLAL
jgi:large subunit ribosomal protein L13